MSSKSNARLPCEPLTSIRIAFLRPVANRVASKTPERSAGEPGEEHRGVVDGDGSHSPAAGGAGEAAGLAGDRALLDEGLELAGHLVDRGRRVMYWVRSTMWAPMSPSAPEPACSLSSRHESGASGSAIQSWRYCARTWRTSPIRPSATSWRASAIAGTRR